MREAEELHADLVDTTSANRNIARLYDVAIPCYRERVLQIMEAAATGKTVDPSLLKYAPIVLTGPDAISPEDYQLLRARYGSKERRWIDSVEFNLRSAEVNGRGLESQWNEFQRLNPAHGPVTAQDRSAARSAAVKAIGFLQSLQKSFDFIKKLTGLMNIPPKPNAILQPVSSCDEMWRTGKAYKERG